MDINRTTRLSCGDAGLPVSRRPGGALTTVAPPGVPSETVSDAEK
ncbi:hypothetical protein L083_6755 [Actinoplanes sp. N902-109]|nr:hypothetical protein L083_6755 [Actinoplanes sp. N902-109]